MRIDPDQVAPVSVVAAKSVLNAIAWYTDENGGDSHPGAGRLSTHTGLTVRSVRRVLAALEAAELIARAGNVRTDGTRTKSTIYRVTVTGDTVTGATPSPLAPPKGATPSPFRVVKGATPSPEQNNTTLNTTSAREGLGEVSEAWLHCTRHVARRGVCLTSAEVVALSSMLDRFELLEILDAIGEIDRREYPRPLIPWIADKIENRRKRQKKKKANAGDSITRAWQGRAGRVAPSASIAERLKERGNK